MPTVKVELLEGRSKEYLLKLRDVIMNSVVASLQLPENDRNIRILEYPEGLFQMKAPNEILVEVSMFSGRSKDTKRKLFKTIVSNLEANGLLAKEKVLILLNEQPLENWGVRGGIPADEVELGFKVNI